MQICPQIICKDKHVCRNIRLAGNLNVFSSGLLRPSNVFARGQEDIYPASSGFSRSDATLQCDRNYWEQPFAFPSSMHVHVMTTNIPWQDGNENFNKTMGLISKTTTLHVHHAFIFAFLCHFCTNTTWICLILRFMDNVNKQRRNLFFFLLLSLDMVPWNSIPFGFAYIWQSKKIGINNPRKYWISTAGSH